MRLDDLAAMDPRITRALARMEYYLATPQTIASLAADVNLSPSRFARLFRREVGAPPARYLHALRLVRAQLLLERTVLSVDEVMAQVGCHDAIQFAHDFRRFHGVSPEVSRQRARATGKALLRGDRSKVVASIAALANQRIVPKTPRSLSPGPSAEPSMSRPIYVPRT